MKSQKRETKNKVKRRPWPTKAVMEQIYEQRLWGDIGVDFYSGEGSHNSNIIDPYITAITSFLRSFKKPLVVCDLGCGDFNIGKELVPHCSMYHAIDIVPELIKRNQEKFINQHLKFHCLDIVVDQLPSSDCVIVRQVLQHLSNTEVQGIVNKLSDYNYVILTEHIPEGDFEANKEIISGQGIRLKKQSGINITAPPFNFKATEEHALSSISLNDSKGIIATTLYQVF